MDPQSEEIHVTTDQARGGMTGMGVRYVLAITLILALVVMGVLFLGGTAGPSREGTAPSEPASDGPAAMPS